MPPLLKSLSTRATNPIRNLVFLSKSERLSQLEGLNIEAFFKILLVKMLHHPICLNVPSSNICAIWYTD